MKRYGVLVLFAGLLGAISVGCEKEKPAEEIAGNYTGVLDGVYGGNDTITGGYVVTASVSTKNKVKIEGDGLFPAFEVLVTQNGANVVPVSTDNEVYQFLYQGDENLKELSFKFYKNGDSTIYVGTKP